MVGAGADDVIGLVARTFLGPGRKAAVQPPTYPLYAIASGVEGTERRRRRPLEAGRARRGRRRLGLQSGESDRRARRARDDRGAGRRAAGRDRGVDEAYFEYAGEDGRSVRAARAERDRDPQPVEGVRLRGSPGRVRRRVEGGRGRARSPSFTGPGVTVAGTRIAAAALREPVLDVESEVAERERMLAMPRRGRFRLSRARMRTSSTSRSRTVSRSPTDSMRRALSSGGTQTRSGSRRGCPRRTIGCLRRSAPRPCRPTRKVGRRGADERGDRAPDLARPRRAAPFASQNRRRVSRSPADTTRVSRSARPRCSGRRGHGPSTSTTRSRT